VKCQWHFKDLRTPLIEPVNDVTGADKAPVKGGVAAKRSFEAVKRAALRKAPSPASLIPPPHFPSRRKMPK
jgi:hypothetical protein